MGAKLVGWGCLLSGVAVFAGAQTARAETLEVGAPAANFAITEFVSGLDTPTSFAFLPDGRMLITDKGGQLLLADKAGATQTVGMFTVSTVSEQGLLHVLVHPSFATNRLLLFYYSAADSIGGTDADRNRVVTVKLDGTDHLDMTSETILVRGLRGPANHDGGALAIGPDGKLYIGDGDTGCNSNKPPEPAYTPTNFFATCLTYPNGKILRVNLDGTVPTDNPLVGQTVTACGATCDVDVTTLAPSSSPRTDIWAWGFRNPWRFWIDPKTQNLWVGDVGEVTYEEVDVIPPSGKGKHYGWPWREGAKGHPVSACQAIMPAGDCVDPQYYCKHGAGVAGIDGNCTAITGGLIVDSCQFPQAFRGLYFFGDSSSKWIATLQPTADRNSIVPGPRVPFARTTGAVVHMDVGPDGALYYASISGAGASAIERIAPKVSACSPADAGSGGAAGAGGGGSAGATSGAGGATAAGGSMGGSAGGGANAGAGASAGTAGSVGGGVRLDASAGAASPARAAGDTGGCGCRAAPRGRPGFTGFLGIAGLVSLAWRRGRRRRRDPIRAAK